MNKEKLWQYIPEFIDNLIAFYGDALPDFATAHYADGGYCAVLLKQKTGIGFTFTGHSLGAQKLDKLGMNADNVTQMEQQYRSLHAHRSRTHGDDTGQQDHHLDLTGTYGAIQP